MAPRLGFWTRTQPTEHPQSRARGCAEEQSAECVVIRIWGRLADKAFTVLRADQVLAAWEHQHDAKGENLLSLDLVLFSD